MNISNARNSSTPATTSTLRPRVRRLISGLDDDNDDALTESGSALSSYLGSANPTSRNSRPVSPIPVGHLSRPDSNKAGRSGSVRGETVGSAGSRRLRTQNNASTSSLADLWGDSWTTIQGIASDLLGNDVVTGEQSNRPARARKTLHKPRYSTWGSNSVPPSEWGPSNSASLPTVGDIGSGMREEQIADFRAQKRRDMLTQRESSYADALGRFKRRSSNEGASMSAPPGDQEHRDALVYIHHVEKSDTLAGITIRYNCTANTLRKANRMWPNDTVQSKKTIILPVDACAVKGRPVSGPEAMDLLGSEFDALSAGQAEEVPSLSSTATIDMDGAGRNRGNSVSTTTSHRISTGTSNHEHEQPWQHDSWVLLPGSIKPTEIARLSRRALCYFPPTRRKSNGMSDRGTPSTSLDLIRAESSDLANNSLPSPSRNFPSSPSNPNRHASNTDSGYFPSYLNGPGGVGTLNRNVRVPGPAQDSLNALFAKHLPDVAPPRHHSSLLTPTLPLYSDSEPTPTVTDLPSPFNPNIKPLNLENVGGAIETWMRRLATKAKDATQPSERQAARASVGAPGKGAGAIGDLIEMTDEFEIGADDDDEDEAARGRQNSVIHIPSTANGSGSSYLDDGLSRVRERGSAIARGSSKAGKSD